MENIELFDEFCAAILASLYEAFPVPAAVDARKLSGHGELNDFGRVIDDLGRPSRQFEIAISTADWLKSAGFITSKESNRYGHAGVTLTMAGLQVLNGVPDSVASKESRGAKLVRFIKEGSVGLACEAAKAIISAGVAAGMS